MATLRDKWIAALRSGEYVQCRAELKSSSGGYCCLGVLAELIGEPAWARHHDEGGDLLPESILDANTQADLASRNDGEGKHKIHSFAEIADYIEAHPEIDPVWPPEGE